MAGEFGLIYKSSSVVVIKFRTLLLYVNIENLILDLDVAIKLGKLCIVRFQIGCVK